MARTVEQILREMLGQQQLALAQAIAENERLKDEIAAQKTPKKDADAPR
jgi:hypothetical protein